MAETRQQDPVLLIVAAFSRHLSLLSQAGEKLQEDFGPVALASRPYAFTQTTYYESAMGPGLKKLFLVFADLVAPDCLPEAKLLTNKLEHELARCGAFAEARPINLDPGLLTLGKFMLATTKDQAHRIYLSSGIFAEVTLRYEAGAFLPWPWTYADYRQAAVLEFMRDARDFYRCRLAELKMTRSTSEDGGER